jgi:hypothetical protein
MRPQGEIRQALVRVFQEHGALTRREAAGLALVGQSAAHSTVRNMIDSGQLRKVGQQKAANSGNWEGLYELVPVEEAGSAGLPQPSNMAMEDLVRVTCGWVDVNGGAR